MKISFKGDYALKAVLDLALNYQKEPVKIHDIAKRQDIPIKYLEQILLSLKRSGYLKSIRGAKGGYALGKSPKDIKLGEIIRLMEGPVSPITCVSKSCYEKCNDELKCVFRPLWDKVRISIENIVDKLTFADMCIEYKQKNEEKYNMYYI